MNLNGKLLLFSNLNRLSYHICIFIRPIPNSEADYVTMCYSTTTP